MSQPLNETLVDLINQIGPTAWTDTCYRYTTARRDPLSGEGARRNGGRWNPPGIFPTIYLAQPVSTCMREFERLADSQYIEPQAMLTVPYLLHTIQIAELPVLDLRSVQTQQRLGLESGDLRGDDWSACQAVGHSAWFLEFAGVVAPSATGNGLVVAAFEHRAYAGQVEAVSQEALNPQRHPELLDD